MSLFYATFLFLAINSANASPVLQFKPTPRQSDSGLIWFVPQTRTTYRHYVEDLDKFLTRYKNGQKPANVWKCDPNETPPQNVICDVDVRALAPCSTAPDYCFYRAQICIFLKLSHVTNWVPDFYNSTNWPSDMPLSLKQTIREEEERGTHRKIWVTCDGETPADKEMIGALDYKPSQGFSRQYFPITDTKNYLSPLIAVHFERPRTGVLINVECTAWARNIPRKNKQGIARFGLLLEDML